VPIHEAKMLIKAAQGFVVRRTSVRRSRKPAENAEQGKKGHLWMDTNESTLLCTISSKNKNSNYFTIFNVFTDT
jgi:ribosomal protein L15E